MTHLQRLLFLIIFSTTIGAVSAQGPAYTIAAGPTLSNQRVRGFAREPFLRYHTYLQIESTSEINPNAMYARVGYHLKGSAVNVHSFIDDGGFQHEGSSYAMEFHNVSASIGFKQRRELGTKHYHYGFGVRGDFNVKTKFDLLFQGLEGAQNKFTYGVNVDVGLELPVSELVSVVFELGISPDFADQLFIPPINTGYTYEGGQPIILPETKLRNVVLEARIGLRMWNKIIYTD